MPTHKDAADDEQQQQRRQWEDDAVDAARADFREARFDAAAQADAAIDPPRDGEAREDGAQVDEAGRRTQCFQNAIEFQRRQHGAKCSPG